MSTDILTVSSKGQIVLPIKFRKNNNIKSGTKLFVYDAGDSIVIKLVEVPEDNVFLAALDEAKEWAASVGYTEEDVEKAIKEYREESHK